jgi:hypothetical protein
MTNFNIQQIRADFPILNEKIRGKQLVYLDNGASTQKPQAVIDAEATTTNISMPIFIAAFIICLRLEQICMKMFASKYSNSSTQNTTTKSFLPKERPMPLT